MNTGALVNSREETAFAEERFRDAADLYQKTIELEPGFAAAYRNMGDRHFRTGTYQVALQWYRMAIERAPRDPISYRFAADVYRRMGRQEESRQHLVASLMADPDYPLVWEDLATLGEAEGQRVERRAGFVPNNFLLLSGSETSRDDAAIFSMIPAATAPAFHLPAPQSLARRCPEGRRGDRCQAQGRREMSRAFLPRMEPFTAPARRKCFGGQSARFSGVAQLSILVGSVAFVYGRLRPCTSARVPGGAEKQTAALRLFLL